MSGVDDVILSVSDLSKYFPVRKGFFRRVAGNVQAVEDVSFQVERGETLGLVGESGSGKTTLGRTLVRLIEPTRGEIVLSQLNKKPVELASLSARALKPIRADCQIIFQDPRASLNSRMSVGEIVAEPLHIHKVGTRRERMVRARELLELVGLNADDATRYPHEFSGGQRQRIGIARALSLNPKLIVCDEPVSALDVSVQAQVLNLLKGLQEELGLTYIFITHNLGVASYMCDRIMVMYLGRLVEIASADELYKRPLHPYTAALISSMPDVDEQGSGGREVLQGQIPDPADPPPGCRFHTRCKFAAGVCSTQIPQLRETAGSNTLVACHRAEELEL
ncbi:MAG TPA: ATP-binding cassette domain-containing protein [Devosia sp.]|nr:ATP-binding cassette domain-containing protein [Devosia sp.]